MKATFTDGYRLLRVRIQPTRQMVKLRDVRWGNVGTAPKCWSWLLGKDQSVNPYCTTGRIFVW